MSNNCIKTNNISVKVYSFFYKDGKLITENPIYIPILVGKNKQANLSILPGDDTGNEISAKNKYYSELTGIYWVWKNMNSDIVGTCHYRRFFTTFKEPLPYRIKRLLYFPATLWKKRYGLIYTKKYDFWQSKIISKDEIISFLDDYDAIMPQKRILRKSVREHYNKHHSPDDLILLKEIIKKQYPEYIDSYEKVLQNNRLFANNMFILKWNTFQEMANWLFSILFTFEKKTNLSAHTGYQERIFGFLSERLITIWIIHNKIKYKELKLIYFKKFKEL